MILKQDLRFAIRLLAEKRIEEAMDQGKFANLPGKGEEISLTDRPACEDERVAQVRAICRGLGLGR